MQIVRDKHELDELTRLVQKYLQPYQPDPADYRLEVVPEAIGQDEEWIYVVVEPSREGVRSNDYSSRLVEAELDLQDKEHRKILLVPALPE